MTGFKRHARWWLALGTLAFFCVAIVRQNLVLQAVRAEHEQLRVRAAATIDSQERRSAPPHEPVIATRGEGDRGAILLLQREISQLRERIAAREQALHEFIDARSRARSSKASIVEKMTPYTEWTNAGRTTPEAAVETALWAATRGDLRALQHVLTFDDDATVAARTLFDQLPAEVRAEYERPERFIALLTAGDVPLNAAQICGRDESRDQLSLLVALGEPDKPPRVVKLQARFEAEDGTWRVVVPRAAIDAYAGRLSGEQTSL